MVKLEDFIVIDIETTGFNLEKSYIIEICAIKVEGGKITDEFSTLINPGFPINENVKRITGITNVMLNKKPKIEEVLPSFLEFSKGYTIVGHNVRFDISFINRFSKDILKESFRPRYICTLELSKKLFKGLRDYSLSSMADFLNIKYEKVHRAKDDAYISLFLFQKLLDILYSRMKLLPSYQNIKTLLKR